MKIKAWPFLVLATALYAGYSAILSLRSSNYDDLSMDREKAETDRLNKELKQSLKELGPIPFVKMGDKADIVTTSEKLKPHEINLTQAVAKICDVLTQTVPAELAPYQITSVNMTTFGLGQNQSIDPLQFGQSPLNFKVTFANGLKLNAGFSSTKTGTKFRTEWNDLPEELLRKSLPYTPRHLTIITSMSAISSKLEGFFENRFVRFDRLNPTQTNTKAWSYSYAEVKSNIKANLDKNNIPAQIFDLVQSPGDIRESQYQIALQPTKLSTNYKGETNNLEDNNGTLIYFSKDGHLVKIVSNLKVSKDVQNDFATIARGHRMLSNLASRGDLTPPSLSKTLTDLDRRQYVKSFTP